MSYRKIEGVYPVTVTTYPNGEKSMECITDDDLKEYTRPKDIDDLYRYLVGNTRIRLGVYATDVERWLNNQPVID